MALTFKRYTDGKKRAVMQVKHRVDINTLIAVAATLLDEADGPVEDRPTPSRTQIEAKARELLTWKGSDWLIDWEDTLVEEDAEEIQERAAEIIRTHFKELN